MAVAAHNAFGWGMPVVSVPVTPAVTPNRAFDPRRRWQLRRGDARHGVRTFALRAPVCAAGVPATVSDCLQQPVAAVSAAQARAIRAGDSVVTNRRKALRGIV
jgi:hypothetical protein